MDTLTASDDAILNLGAAALARAIAGGEISATETVSAHIARIEVVQGQINAFVDFDPDAALIAARAADEARSRAEPLGALHGVPVSIKYWIEVEGFRCVGGYEHRKDFRPRRDATVVARLKAAGGIILGKTVTGDGGTLHSRPNNPHDLTRSPGASSSGEAALVAALGSPLGIGSDSGGSIRQPAAWCGVMGLKPSSGRVPLTGHYPPIGALSDPRTVIGPIARRVEDLALAMTVIGGPDGRDPSVAPVPLPDYREVAVAGLRILLADCAGIDETSPATLEALGAAARTLEASGAIIEPADPAWLSQMLEESLAISRDYWARPESTSLRTWTPYGQTRLTGDQIGEHLFRWERLQRQMIEMMGRFDAILMPVSPKAAPPHRPLFERDYLFTLPFSLTGQPVMVAPAGWEEALPIGVQIAARKWEDHVALALAATVRGEAPR